MEEGSGGVGIGGMRNGDEKWMLFGDKRKSVPINLNNAVRRNSSVKSKKKLKIGKGGGVRDK